MSELREKQGFLGNLDEKSKAELVDLLSRQEKLLKNRNFVNNLSDRGEKIRALTAHLHTLIAARKEVDVAIDLMEGMTLADEEMPEPDSLQLEGKDVNVINRIATVTPPRGAFCPHRTLRSNLGDLLEEVSTEDSNISSVKVPGHPPPGQEADIRDSLTTAESHIRTVDLLSPEDMNVYESKCSNLSSKTPDTHRLDPSVNYSFVPCFLLTNRPGEHAEICHLVAKSGSKTFSEYCLPSYVSTGVSRNYGVKIEYRRGVRLLTRNGEDTKAQPTQIVLKNFLTFLEEISGGRIVLIMVGQSNTLIHNFRTRTVQAPDILYADCPRSALMSVSSERILSEQRIVDILSNVADNSPLDLTNSCRIVDLHNAEIDLEESLACLRRLNSFRGKLFDFSMKESEVITRKVARTLSESGLEYGDLDRLYLVSELAMVAVLVRCRDGVRVTRDVGEVAAILRHFKHKHGSRGFDEVLMEGRSERGSKLVPLEESLKLMYDQKKRIERHQIEQAKQRLTKNVSVKMSSFDPESTKSSLRYREAVTKDDSASENEEDGVKDADDDSEAEQDYPE